MLFEGKFRHAEYPEDLDLWPKHPDVGKILRSDSTRTRTVDAWTSESSLPAPESLPSWIPYEVRKNLRWRIHFYEHPELTQEQYWTYNRAKVRKMKLREKFNDLDNMTPMRSSELALLQDLRLVPQVDRNGHTTHDMFFDLAVWDIPKIAYVEWIIPAMNGQLVDWVRYFEERATPGTYLHGMKNNTFKALTSTLKSIENNGHFHLYDETRDESGHKKGWTYTEDTRSLADDPRVTDEYMSKIYKARKSIVFNDPEYRMPKMFEDFFKNTPENIKGPILKARKDARKLKHSQALSKRLYNTHNELLEEYAHIREWHQGYKERWGEYYKTYREDMDSYKNAILTNLRHLNYERKKLGLEKVDTPDIPGMPKKKRRPQGVPKPSPPAEPISAEPEEEFEYPPLPPEKEEVELFVDPDLGIMYPPLPPQNDIAGVSFTGQAYEDYLMAKASNNFLSNM